MKPLQHLRQLIKEESERKHPTLPAHVRVINTFNAVPNKETKQLKRIEKYLNVVGNAKGNIVTNKGVMMPNGVKKYDFRTGVQTQGHMKFRPSTVQNGTSDVVSIIDGRAVSIELKRVYKNGKDRQSDVQKVYQKEVEDAGGLYVIVESFEHFYDWFYTYTGRKKPK